ncbi:MAG: hypothetical protein Q4B14_05765 [Clostridia bacterium]|nr:hypothetical protein [Clostridia bacterium]
MKNKSNIIELSIFALISAVMYLLKLMTAFLPNVHLLTVIMIALTDTYRKKALYPIYGFIMIDGLLSGFAVWWIPYLYIWTIVWVAVMVVPKHINKRLKYIIYTCICTFHGLCFGILYAPSQALFFGMNFNASIAWIVAGLPYDIIHGVSNLIGSFLIPVIISILNKCNKAFLR